MEKIFEIRPMFRQKILLLGIILCLIFAGSIFIGLKPIPVTLFMTLLFIVELIYVSNVFTFYKDRLEITNLVTKNSKQYYYSSIAKIRFNTSKRTPSIRLFFKNGKNFKKASYCLFSLVEKAHEIIKDMNNAPSVELRQ